MAGLYTPHPSRQSPPRSRSLDASTSATGAIRLAAELAAYTVRAGAAHTGIAIGARRQTSVLDDFAGVGRTALSALRSWQGSGRAWGRAGRFGTPECSIFAAARVAAGGVLDAAGAARVHDPAHLAGDLPRRQV